MTEHPECRKNARAAMKKRLGQLRPARVELEQDEKGQSEDDEEDETASQVDSTRNGRQWRGRRVGDEQVGAIAEKKKPRVSALIQPNVTTFATRIHKMAKVSPLPTALCISLTLSTS